MRMFLIKMSDGTWFSNFSPTGRLVTAASWTEAHLFPVEQESDVRDIVEHNAGSQCYETLLTEPVLASTLGDKRRKDTYEMPHSEMDAIGQNAGGYGAPVRMLDLGRAKPGEISTLERDVLRYAVENDGAVMPLGYLDWDSSARLDDVVAACGHLEELKLLSGDGQPASSSTFYDITESGIKAAK